MKIVCAWCERDMGENEHEPRELVTHSICDDCKTNLFGDIGGQPVESPMKDHPLGIAARYNDAECEEHGIATTIAKLGLDIDSLMYIAEQRALRVLWIELGRDMSIFNDPVPKALPLTNSEKRRVVILQSAILDGIVIGWRAARLAAEK